MFSIPVSLAIGDDNYYVSKEARKDQAGGVITGARNFTTKGGKKGTGDEVFFSKPGYITQGDPFKEAGKLAMRQFKKDGHKEVGHD
mmetsp:Transcript_22743/g.21941  ORF Transcript_22743/g.21941 Transcript_22743/m.21941 type:complete len:86 (+) Transcript_22743:84-341(+)